jgi:hypothetical protein
MICKHEGCEKTVEYGKTECFRHRISGVGFSFRGGAVIGRGGWNMTKNDWLREHMGADSEKQLVKRKDVERA